jgi:hypothetical protein
MATYRAYLPLVFKQLSKSNIHFIDDLHLVTVMYCISIHFRQHVHWDGHMTWVAVLLGQHKGVTFTLAVMHHEKCDLLRRTPAVKTVINFTYHPLMTSRGVRCDRVGRIPW